VNNIPNKSNTLFCGPFVGEWGWELMWFNPLCRYHAEKYDHIVVAAPASSRYLYEFADEFIPLNTVGISYCDGYLFGDAPVVEADAYLSPTKEFSKYQNEPDRISTPRKWRNLSPENREKVADILCAFRPKKYGIDGKRIFGKEYPKNKCQQLVDLFKKNGLSVACFGGQDNYCPDGAIDLRGKQLEDQCGAISEALCVVGPSSGPIHLASLCRCPHVTWIASMHHTLGHRYKNVWNPFGSPVAYLGHSIIPEPSIVFHKTVRLINE